MRILDKVREEVTLEKSRSDYPILRPRDLAEKLNVKESVVHQACSILQKEGVLTAHRGTHGTYSIKTRRIMDFSEVNRLGPVPRKRKASWGAKRRILALVRKMKPWVIEKWYEEDQRWWMYMERTEEMIDPNNKKLVINREVAPEDQPDLTRSEIAKWHFETEGALQACAALRRKHPKLNYRTRDTSAGDYIMGAILL
jgi:hypothetical protein